MRRWTTVEDDEDKFSGVAVPTLQSRPGPQLGTTFVWAEVPSKEAVNDPVPGSSPPSTPSSPKSPLLSPGSGASGGGGGGGGRGGAKEEQRGGGGGGGRRGGRGDDDVESGLREPLHHDGHGPRLRLHPDDALSAAITLDSFEHLADNLPLDELVSVYVGRQEPPPPPHAPPAPTRPPTSTHATTDQRLASPSLVVFVAQHLTRLTPPPPPRSDTRCRSVASTSGWSTSWIAFRSRGAEATYSWRCPATHWCGILWTRSWFSRRMACVSGCESCS